MPELIVRLKKNKDGSAALTCVRADGSATWQTQRAGIAAFFTPHDLTHFAVETALGCRNAFFGLVADGWELTDFAQPWPRGLPPVEARQVENIVSGFDMDRTQGVASDASAFNARVGSFIAANAAAGRSTVPQRILTQAELEKVRELRNDLISRWLDATPGSSLELRFENQAPAEPIS